MPRNPQNNGELVPKCYLAYYCHGKQRNPDGGSIPGSRTISAQWESLQSRANLLPPGCVLFVLRAEPCVSQLVQAKKSDIFPISWRSFPCALTQPGCCRADARSSPCDSVLGSRSRSRSRLGRLSVPCSAAGTGPGDFIV